jgi:hypothetical protein
MPVPRIQLGKIPAANRPLMFRGLIAGKTVSVSWNRRIGWTRWVAVVGLWRVYFICAEVGVAGRAGTRRGYCLLVGETVKTRSKNKTRR